MCYNWGMEENNLKDNLQTLELALKKQAQIANFSLGSHTF